MTAAPRHPACGPRPLPAGCRLTPTLARLRAFVSAQGSEQAVAERMGFTHETVSRALTGHAPISPDFRDRFMTTFGLEAYRAVFLADDETQEEPTL